MTAKDKKKEFVNQHQFRRRVLLLQSVICLESRVVPVTSLLEVLI